MKLIFIHGSGNTREVWHYQTEHFPDSQAINLPGHPEGKLCTSVEEYADWLHQHILKQNHHEPVLAGHSLGGAVALMYTLKYPRDVKAIILIGTGARLRVNPEYLSLVEAGISNPSAWLSDFIKSLYIRVAPQLREKVTGEIAELGATVQLNDFRCCDNFDVMDRLHLIKIPTMVICGSEDQMTPVKYSRYLADKIEGARPVVIEDSTHLAFMEKPDEVNQAIEQFLNGL